MTQRKIWGFEVATSPKGKNIWPYDLKREVVRRILDDDQHIGTMLLRSARMNASFENGVLRHGVSVERLSLRRSPRFLKSRSRQKKPFHLMFQRSCHERH